MHGCLLGFTKICQNAPPFRAGPVEFPIGNPIQQGGDEWHPLLGAWGSLFKLTTICPVVFGTAPNSDVITAAAPQRKVACMTDLACACPVKDVQAIGAVRAAGLNWVAVLKRDPHASGFREQIGMPARKRGVLY